MERLAPVSPMTQRLSLKAIRLAVHGWLLGNPLVYKPGASDLDSIAHELAATGAPSGALILDDEPMGGDHGDAPASTANPDGSRPETVHAVLILRYTATSQLLGTAAAHALAEVAQATIGLPCDVQWPWRVVVHHEQGKTTCLGSVSVEDVGDATLVGVHLLFSRLRQVAEDHAEAGAPVSLFARGDWREVMLARMLHTLESRLATLGER